MTWRSVSVTVWSLENTMATYVVTLAAAGLVGVFSA
jgi:hypothetical protein